MNKRIRVNARLPDHDGKFRDEITQEFTIELDDEKVDLDTLISQVNDRMNEELTRIMQRIKVLGGKDYTEA